MTTIPSYRRPHVNTQPKYADVTYHSTAKCAPSKPLILLPYTLSEVTEPLFDRDEIQPGNEQSKGRVPRRF